MTAQSKSVCLAALAGVLCVLPLFAAAQNTGLSCLQAYNATIGTPDIITTTNMPETPIRIGLARYTIKGLLIRFYGIFSELTQNAPLTFLPFLFFFLLACFFFFFLLRPHKQASGTTSRGRTM